MNRERAMKVANAVLYEGYMLYPYRRSALKNRQRWSFGIVYPPDYHEVAAGTERSQMHSEILVQVTEDATLQVQVRFLHLIVRDLAAWVGGQLQPVESLTVNGERVESYQEGIERSLECELKLFDGAQQGSPFLFSGSVVKEALRNADGEVVGEAQRRQHEIAGTLSVSAVRVRETV